MKHILLLLAAAAGSSAQFAAAKACDVTISAELPPQVSLTNLYVSTYQRDIAVTAHKFNLCVSKRDLNINGQHNPNNKVYLVDKSGDAPSYLYSALVFVQDKTIELGAVSTLANYACDNRCGYYANARLKADATLKQRAAQYEQIDKKAKDERSAFLRQHQKELTALYLQQVKLTPLSASQRAAISDPDLWVDPYSGAALLFKNKDVMHQQAFEAGVGDSIKNTFTQYPKLQPQLKTHKKDILAIMSGGLSWAQKGEAIKALTQAFSGYNQPELDALAKVFADSYQNAPKDYQAYLSNAGKTPFVELTQANSRFEQVLANWTLAAYSHSKNAEAFAALFSGHFKQQLPIKDKALDSALSRLITLPSHLGKMSLENGYNYIQVEFAGQLAPSNSRYDFSDALHSVSFVYEQGAWRLDSLSQVAMNQYES